ncbi:MAG: hypothetical protein SPG64_02440 [Candidatus Enteromonas sp.]|nr:hypothetical protein [Candidatus Enteromonas sp.]
MKLPILADSLGWLTPVIIFGVFALIVLIVIIVKKHVKTFQSDEKPKSDREVAAEELDRILEPIEDESAQRQMHEFDQDK